MVFAEQRSDITQYELGQMFRKAPQQERDYNQSAEWFALSAQRGNAKAQYNLGVMYVRGLGVKVDYLQAYVWLKLASVQGSEKALHCLHKLTKKMPTNRIHEAHRLSRQYYEKYVVPYAGHFNGI